MNLKERTYTKLLGGGGLYATYGMKAVTDRVGYVAKYGDDFDPTPLRGLGITLLEVLKPFKTPRALITLKNNHLTFELVTEFEDYHHFRTSCFDVPTEWPITHVHGVLGWKRIKPLAEEWPNRFIVWEPNPDDLKNASELWNNWKYCTSSVFITSPNHIEALELIKHKMPSYDSIADTMSYFIEVSKLISIGSAIIVLRCSYYGSLVNFHGKIAYIPPYYTSRLLIGVDDAEIVDSTGCGNTFLGALTAYLSVHDNSFESIVNGCRMGSIAAGLTLEQFGPFSYDNGLFNNSTMEERLEIYKEKELEVKRMLPFLF